MRISSLVLVSLLSLSVAACDKDKEPEDVKAGKDEESKKDDDKKDDGDDEKAAKDDDKDEDAAEAKDGDTAEAKDDGDEGEVEVKVATTATPNTTTTTTTQRFSGENINDCCGALAASARSSKSPKVSSAAATCHSLNAMVKKGNTTRAAALAQVRAFAGSDAPASCR